MEGLERVWGFPHEVVGAVQESGWYVDVLLLTGSCRSVELFAHRVAC